MCRFESLSLRRLRRNIFPSFFFIFDYQLFLMEENDYSPTRYTHSEEVANTISHLLGVVMSLVVCPLFLSYAYKANDTLSIFCLWIYFFGVTASYLASSLYHVCPPDKVNSKLLLRKFDHAAIYWHIAGSYTPITLIAMYKYGVTEWAVSIFALVWLCAIIGTILTFRKIKTHSYFKTACYVMMGLLILVAFKPFYDSVGVKTVVLVILEGVSYIVGAVLYSFKKIKYIHSVFHVFVLLGDVFHILALWRIIQLYLIVL